MYIFICQLKDLNYACEILFGWQRAILKASGNFPSANGRFMIVVIDPSRKSVLSLTIWVGHGSRSHDLLGDDQIYFATLLSETCEKVSKGFGETGGVGSE